jgi:hypothetical protein
MFIRSLIFDLGFKFKDLTLWIEHPAILATINRAPSPHPATGSDCARHSGFAPGGD